MTTINEFQIMIDILSDDKGWSKDQVWLMYSVFKEVGEMCQAIEHNRSQTKIGEEFADVMHFLLQLLSVKAPLVNPDYVLKRVIKRNRNRPKKTYTPNGDFKRV